MDNKVRNGYVHLRLVLVHNSSEVVEIPGLGRKLSTMSSETMRGVFGDKGWPRGMVPVRDEHIMRMFRVIPEGVVVLYPVFDDEDAIRLLMNARDIEGIDDAILVTLPQGYIERAIRVRDYACLKTSVPQSEWPLDEWEDAPAFEKETSAETHPDTFEQVLLETESIDQQLPIISLFVSCIRLMDAALQVPLAISRIILQLVS
jgi:hypothetical protein